MAACLRSTCGFVARVARTSGARIGSGAADLPSSAAVKTSIGALRRASAASPAAAAVRLFGRPRGGATSAASFSSSSSHPDFAPQRKTVGGEDEALALIRQHVSDNPVMLYMKGNPSMPMCGFSAKVVQTLQKEGVDFASVNVLDYPSIREGIKKFSDWPTIPQLYVKGEFIGGCDIVLSMHQSGELKELLAEVPANKEAS